MKAGTTIAVVAVVAVVGYVLVQQSRNASMVAATPVQPEANLWSTISTGLVGFFDYAKSTKQPTAAGPTSRQQTYSEG